MAEIKSNTSGADVTEVFRTVQLFEPQTKRTTTKRILVAVTTIQQAALERAKELGIIVATGFASLKQSKTSAKLMLYRCISTLRRLTVNSERYLEPRISRITRTEKEI